jgi:hypothetical protein
MYIFVSTTDLIYVKNDSYFKAACLQVHANFQEFFTMYLKVKYCQVSKESNLHIAECT